MLKHWVLSVPRETLQVASFQNFCPHSSVMTNTNPTILCRAFEKKEVETVTAGLLNPDWEAVSAVLTSLRCAEATSHKATSLHSQVTLSLNSSL